MPSDLEKLSDAIFDFSERRFEEERKRDLNFLAKNKPLKEFSIERDGEIVEYGVWQGSDRDDLMILFKIKGTYSLRNRIFYDKQLVKALAELSL